jgi:hypothetical protein
LVRKTVDEINEMKAEIAAGTLPPDAIKRYREEEDRNVYGHDAEKRRDGSYIEQVRVRHSIKRATRSRPTANMEAPNLSTRKI